MLELVFKPITYNLRIYITEQLQHIIPFKIAY
jgi:hypothetical protein